MKTLTLSPETNDPKDARRADYVSRERKQDHGTRGTSAEKKFWESVDEYEQKISSSRQRQMSHLVVQESINDAIDEQLAVMSPRKLEMVASNILRAAGFVDEDPEISFLDTPNPDLEQEARAYNKENVSNEEFARHQDFEAALDELEPESQYVLVSGQDPDPWSRHDDRDISTPNTSAEEIEGLLKARRAQMFNADRLYQGQIDPVDDMGDFVDGFHITDRP